MYMGGGDGLRSLGRDWPARLFLLLKAVGKCGLTTFPKDWWNRLNMRSSRLFKAVAIRAWKAARSDTPTSMHVSKTARSLNRWYMDSRPPGWTSRRIWTARSSGIVADSAALYTTTRRTSSRSHQRCSTSTSACLRASCTNKLRVNSVVHFETSSPCGGWGVGYGVILCLVNG